MKLFCHINEYESVSFSVLTPMLLSGESVVLWSPSGAKLQRAIDSGKLPFRLRDVIDLIERGRIQIAGREEWFSQRQRETGAFGSSDSQVWLREFDGRIGQWAALADGNVVGDKVISLGPRREEKGRPWADRQVRRRNSSRAFKAAGSLIEGTGESLGARERWEQVGSADERIHLALRMAKNGEHARQATGSDLSIYPEPQAVRVAALCGQRGHAAHVPGAIFDEAKVAELLELIAALSPIPNYWNLLHTMERVQPFRSAVEVLLFGKAGVTAELAAHIEAELEKDKRRLVDVAVTRAGIGVGLASVLAEAWGVAFGTAVGAVSLTGSLTLAGAAFTAREAYSHFELDRVRSPDGLSSYWYALTQTTNPPTKRRARALLKKLKQRL